MNKKLSFGFLSVTILVYLYLIYNPIIIETSHGNLTHEYKVNYLKEDNIKMFDAFNFDSDNWKVCVIIKDRTDISSKLPYGKYLFTTDIKTIKKMKDLSFTHTGGDMTTVENEIIFYRNNQIVFRSNIVLDEKITGLQSSDFGWVSENGTTMILIIEEFSRPFLPIVYL